MTDATEKDGKYSLDKDSKLDEHKVYFFNYKLKRNLVR
jgi:hypothetical protein